MPMLTSPLSALSHMSGAAMTSHWAAAVPAAGTDAATRTVRARRSTSQRTARLPPGAVAVSRKVSLANCPHRHRKPSASAAASLASPSVSAAPSLRCASGSRSPPPLRVWTWRPGGLGVIPQAGPAGGYPSFAHSALTASRVPGLIWSAGTVQPRPTEAAVISEVFQILKSAGPCVSRPGTRQFREIPGAAGTPMKPKMASATASGSAARSSYLTRWQRSGYRSSALRIAVA